MMEKTMKPNSIGLKQFYQLVIGAILQARIKAEGEYDIYRVIQDHNYESDFDKEMNRLRP
jgi:hypothetical protein